MRLSLIQQSLMPYVIALFTIHSGSSSMATLCGESKYLIPDEKSHYLNKYLSRGSENKSGSYKPEWVTFFPEYASPTGSSRTDVVCFRLTHSQDHPRLLQFPISGHMPALRRQAAVVVHCVPLNFSLYNPYQSRSAFKAFLGNQLSTTPLSMLIVISSSLYSAWKCGGECSL